MVKNSGITLIELMVTLAIVAILAALAVPSYQQYIRKARRADAQSALVEFAGVAERIYTASNSYATVTLPASTDFYTFSFPTTPTANTFIIKATPAAIQSKDKCGSMTLNQASSKTSDGTEVGCW